MSTQNGRKVKDQDLETLNRLLIQGKTEEIETLLNKCKLDINKPMFGSEYFALRYAVEKGHVSTVKMLIDRGADPNLGTPGSYWPHVQVPPLFYAAENGYVEICELLVAAGANPYHEVQGRKAKTITRNNACYPVLRKAEEDFKPKLDAERAEAKAKAKADAQAAKEKAAEEAAKEAAAAAAS
jgi:ankyrin repeat protein